MANRCPKKRVVLHIGGSQEWAWGNSTEPGEKAGLCRHQSWERERKRGVQPREEAELLPGGPITPMELSSPLLLPGSPLSHTCASPHLLALGCSLSAFLPLSCTHAFLFSGLPSLSALIHKFWVEVFELGGLMTLKGDISYLCPSLATWAEVGPSVSKGADVWGSEDVEIPWRLRAGSAQLR